ncbi:putative phage tail protein [Escherichia coli]|uniref:putative phage tail protein n=1 Tax=Escherichia coli TaxID=562 RepID=UPI002FCD0A36
MWRCDRKPRSSCCRSGRQYLALPECGIAATTTEARRRAVVEKYRRKGGLATWQIEAAAAALGFTIKVTAVLPHHCLRDCMYPLHPARYRWLLKVEVPERCRAVYLY